MPIQDELATVIRKTRYYPELIPFIHTQDLVAGDTKLITLTSPTVSVDKPLITGDLSTTPDADVLLKLKADKPSHEAETISLDVMGELSPMEFLVTKSLSLTLNADAPVTDYMIYLGIWVVSPSVAQKLLWGLPLTAEDEALSAKRGVRDSVAKGVLPFPIPYEIERECMGFKRTYAKIVASAATGTTTPIITESPLEGEILVLESVSADATGLVLADNAQLYVTRDDDTDYLKLPIFAMSKTYDLPCFIPALRKLEVNFYHEHGVALTDRYVRVVIGRYKLTDILNARFGRPASAEALEVIKAGVVP